MVGSFQRLCFLPAVEVAVDGVPAVPPYISERYKVGRMLGDGNFAVVRECVEHSTGREYALKIINKGKCRGKVSQKRSCLWLMTAQLRVEDEYLILWHIVKPAIQFSLFLPVKSIFISLFQEHMIQNEVAILRRVKHPNIVLLIEEVDTYNELYLVMELVKACVHICSLFQRGRLRENNRQMSPPSSGFLYILSVMTERQWQWH